MGFTTVTIDRHPWDRDEILRLCRWLQQHRQLREIDFSVTPIGPGDPWQVQVTCKTVADLVPVVKLIGWYEARLGTTFEDM